jgi:hypothetical protein
MKIAMLAVLTLVACGDHPVVAPAAATPPVVLKKNVARDNALVTYPDAKCDEVGFEEPTIHSVRCTLKNGVRIYCTASASGSGCNPIYVPDEVAKQAQAAQEAEAARQLAARQPEQKAKK